MQAAGTVHRDDLKFVMDKKKEAVQREAAPIVEAVKKLRSAGGDASLEFRLHDGTNVIVDTDGSSVSIDIVAYIEWGAVTTGMTIGDILRGKLESPNVAEITTYISDVRGVRIGETPPRFRTLLLEVARQLTGKKVVTTWVKDVGYKYGRGAEEGKGRDVPRETRLVQDKMKAHPGALVVLLTGHLKK